MAKVNAPLMSFGASGALAKALVYFSWKGIDCVRQFVIPSNPKTTKQTTQRTYMGDAVDAIHAMQIDATHPLGDVDATAYATWASCFANPRTWFNQAVKNQVDAEVAGDTPALFGDGDMDNSTPGQIDAEVWCNEATIAAGKFFYGLTKTAMLNSVAATVTTKQCTATLPSLTAGTKYFIQFRADAGDPCEGAESGIYSEYAT